MAQKQNVKASTALKIMGFIPLIGGFIFLLVSLWLFVEGQNFKKNALTTTAVITDIQTASERDFVQVGTDTKTKKVYTVYVEYEAGGKKYSGMLDSYVTGMNVGESLTVYYDPVNPAVIKSEYGTEPTILIFGAAGFMLVGIIMIVISSVSGRKQRNVVNTGIMAVGVITDVYIDRNVSVNNCNPYKAECQVIDARTNEMYLYSSDSYTNDIRHLKGCKVPVYYNPDDPSEYYIDLDNAYCDNDSGLPVSGDCR